MGLAEELKPGVWKIADRSESVLKQLGQHGDIMKTMQRVLKESGIDRGASDYTIFDASHLSMKITGKVVAMGLSNELQDHHYAVVDGTDGKLHYAEIGRLSKYDPPGKDMVVTIRSQDPDKQQHQSRQVTARIFIESHVPFRELATSDGATWLDRKILAKNQEIYRDKGFGAQANRAIRMRQQWLIKEELMTERNGQLVVRRKLLETLQRREISRVARQIQKELGLSYSSAAAGERSNGKIRKFVKLASGRFVIVQKGKEFSLVPWRKVFGLKKNAGISIGS